MLKNFAQNVFKWHYFDQVYSRFTRDGKMAFFTSQTRPLRWETSQRRQPEVFLAVISLPLAVTDVCRRRILSRLLYLIIRLNWRADKMCSDGPPERERNCPLGFHASVPQTQVLIIWAIYSNEVKMAAGDSWPCFIFLLLLFLLTLTSSWSINESRKETENLLSTFSQQDTSYLTDLTVNA